MARSFPGSGGQQLAGRTDGATNITGTAMTLAAWIKPNTSGVYKKFAAKHIEPSQRHIAFGLDVTGPLVCLVGDGGGGFDQPVATTTVVAGKWQHAVMVKDGTGANALRMYLDGKLDSSTTSNIVLGSSGATFMLGRFEGAGQEYDGGLANVGIWNYALSLEEIRLLAQGGSPLSIKPQFLKGCWILDEYVGAGQALDSSPYGQTLAMTGAITLVESALPNQGGHAPGMAPVFGVSLGPATPAIQPGFISATTVLYAPKVPVDWSPVTLIAATTVLFAFTVQVEVDRFPVFIAATTVVVSPKLAQPIVNVTLPQISGTPTQGLVLSCSTGTWTGTPPLTYTYQWRRCDSGGGACANISGATNPAYIVQAADVAGTLRCVVTASDQ